jgi:drug/metabolite transporter (DMT)-like permease
VTQSVQSSRAGVGFAFGAALLFGVSTPFAKVFLDHIDPWMLVGLMFSGAGLGLLAIYGIGRALGQAVDFGSAIEPKDWGWLTASILIGGVVAPVLLMFGLTNSPASAVALLLNFEGVFTALIAWLGFGERLTKRLVVGIAIITTGGIILSQSGQTDLGFSWGSLAVLGTCLSWGMDNNLTHQVADRNLMQVSLLKSGVAGIITIVVAVAIGNTLPQPQLVSIAMLLGFLSYGLTLICYILALRYIGAARSAAIFALSPFVSAAIAVIILDESLTLNLVIAAVLMAGGVALSLSRQMQKSL